MQRQYNVPIIPLTEEAEKMIQGRLRPYSVFSDEQGNLDHTGFFEERLPYVGRLIVIKTLKEEAARTAYAVLTGVEGLVVLPVTECRHEDDKARFEALNNEIDTTALDVPTFLRTDLCDRILHKI